MPLARWLYAEGCSSRRGVSISGGLRMKRAHVLACLGGMLILAGCDWLDDRFKTCRDVRVDLLNSQQTLDPIHLVGPDESFDSSNRLESGASRSLVQCLEKGDRKKFRAGSLNGDTIGLVTCVAEKSSYEGQPVPQVVWFTTGFECLDW
jgi:hypothetical protein